MILTTEKKVGHYQEHKCGLYGPWKSADYEQLILDPYEYHFPGAGYLLAMLYCSLHLQRAAEKSTTQTRQEHQSTGNILTRYLENTDFSYVWTKYWLPRLGLVWFFRFRFFKLGKHFPSFAIYWLFFIALCIYKVLLKNLHLRSSSASSNTKVQV